MVSTATTPNVYAKLFCGGTENLVNVYAPEFGRHLAGAGTLEVPKPHS